MIENIKNSFLSIVKNSHWMDEETKANAVKKVTIFDYNEKDQVCSLPMSATLGRSRTICFKGEVKNSSI